MSKLLTASAMLLLVSGVALAHVDKPCYDTSGRDLVCKKLPYQAAPEMNATSAAAALTLLVGGLLVLRGRKSIK